MNLFAELLANTQMPQATATGPRIQKRRGVEIKSAREVKIMREASRIVATVLREVMAMVEPGQTTGDLDAMPRRGSARWVQPQFQGLPRISGKYLAPASTTKSSTASPAPSG